jgi:hypothetical protein
MRLQMRLNRRDGTSDARSPQRHAWSVVVVRGRIELPTFRFSGTRVTAAQHYDRERVCDPRATTVLVVLAYAS